MKIVSKHRDYYDGVQGLGIDEQNVYLRFQETFCGIDGESVSEVNAIYAKAPHVWMSIRRSKSEKYGAAKVLPAVLGVAGRHYLVYELTLERRLKPHERRKPDLVTGYATDMSGINEFLNKHVGIKALDEWHEGKGGRVDRTDCDTARDFERQVVWSAHASDDLFFRYKAPVLLFMSDDMRRRRMHNSVYTVLTNPILGDLKFASVLDPYTAFQQIAQYNSGVLGANQNPMIEISDKDQIAKKGFDQIYGFRTRPADK